MTLRFELLGDPVSHSVSPHIHRAAFEAWGVDATYVARRVTREELPAAMRAIRPGAGGNVTLPHKLHALKTLERATDDARATRACNCFWRDREGMLAGDNTDVEGLRDALRAAGLTAPEGRVLILGAGGGARAAALATSREGAATIDIANRSPARARALARDLALPALRVIEAVAPGARYDLALNATPLGLRPEDPLPLDLSEVECATAYDLAYARGGTTWTAHARGLGIPAADGRLMLVHQAARSLRRWFPERMPPLPAMLAAAEGRLAAAE